MEDCVSVAKNAAGLEAVIARSHIAPGTRVLRELPLVCVPVDGLTGICHNCLHDPVGLLEKPLKFQCPECNFEGLCCTPECQGEYGRRHTTLECDLLQCLSFQAEEGASSQELRLAIRLLATPGAVATALDMCSRGALLPVQQEDYDGWSDALGQALRVTEHADVLEALPEKEKTILHLFRVISFCAWKIRTPKGATVGWGLYHRASVFNHSCRPNMATHVGKHGVFTTVATTTVRPEEECCIAYHLDLYQPRCDRAQSFGNFECQCKRCLASGGDDATCGDGLLTAFQCPGCSAPRPKSGGTCAACGASCDTGAEDIEEQAKALLKRVEDSVSKGIHYVEMIKGFLKSCKHLHPLHHHLYPLYFWLVFGTFRTDTPTALSAATRLMACLEYVMDLPWTSDSSILEADSDASGEPTEPPGCQEMVVLGCGASGKPLVSLGALNTVYSIVKSVSRVEAEQAAAAQKLAAVKAVLRALTS